MSKIVQSIDGEGNATAMAEFTLRGDGVHAVYHNPRFRRQIEVDGIYVDPQGTLRPSDGQAFLDALPLAFSHSTFVRVVDGGGHTDDWDEGKHPRDHGKFSSSEGASGGEGKAAKGGKTAQEHHAEAKAHAGKAKEHAKKLRKVAEKHPAPEHEEAAEKAEGHAEKAIGHSQRAGHTEDPGEAEHHAHQAKAHSEAAGGIVAGLKDKVEHLLGKLGKHGGEHIGDKPKEHAKAKGEHAKPHEGKEHGKKGEKGEKKGKHGEKEHEKHGKGHGEHEKGEHGHEEHEGGERHGEWLKSILELLVGHPK